MKYFLYKFSDNWADEMDIEGFTVLTEDEKDQALVQIKKDYKKGGTISFGTNEDNEYSNLKEVMDCISFDEITAVEYSAIKKAFGCSHMGELGPLDTDFDDEAEYCDHCGEELEIDGLCPMCDDEDEDDYEEEYKEHANLIKEFIKKTYGIEETPSYEHHSRFIWKPTPKSEIDITISLFEDGDEEVELNLKVNGKGIRYEFLKVEDVYQKPGKKLKDIIVRMIEKAKSCQ